MSPTPSPTPGPEAKPAPGGARSSFRRLLGAALLVEALLLAILVKHEVTWSGNESTRLATVERLVEGGSFSIEGARYETVDRARIGGRFFSDKPLPLALWLSTIDWPLHAVARLDFAHDANLLIALLTGLGVTSFSLLLSLLFAWRLRRHGFPPAATILLSLAVVGSTWILSFGTSINNHTPAAALLFAFVLLLERFDSAPSARLEALAGILVGGVAALEIPTGGVFLLVGLAVVARAPREARMRSMALFAAGFAIPTALHAGANLLAWGNPLPAYLVPGAFDFPGNVHTTGIAGLHRPTDLAGYLSGILVGPRGLFSHQPLLLLGLAWLWRERRRLGDADLFPAIGVAALVAFYATRTGDFGGWAYGFRFFIPVVPLLFWWSCRWWGSAGRGRTPLFASLAMVGVVTSAVGALNPWPVVWEGAASAPGQIEEEVRSPFLANLLVASFEHDREGAIFRWLVDDVYGPRLAFPYLEKGLRNLRRSDLVPALRRTALEWPAASPRPSPR